MPMTSVKKLIMPSCEMESREGGLHITANILHCREEKCLNRKL